MVSTKKITLASLLVALITTTAVTTATFEDEDDAGQQPCQSQLKDRQFLSCQRYLSQRIGPKAEEHNQDILEMIGSGNPGQQQQQDSLRECCQQLKKVNEECRCEAIERAVRQTQQKEGQPTGQSQVFRKATELPRVCKMRPQQCQIWTVSV